MLVKDLVSSLEFFYPLDLAYEWDNVGLLVGDENAEISGILTTLELTLDVVFEAIERESNVIVCHHPIIFSPLKKLNYKDPVVKILKTLIQNDIAVYAMHTNVDVASNGMNDWLCEILNIKNPSILQPTVVKNYHKITIETTQERLFNCIEVLKTTSIGQKGKKIQNYNITPQIKYYKDLDQEEKEKEIVILESFVKDEDLTEIKNKFYKEKIFNYQIMPIENLVDRFGLGRIGTTKPLLLEQLADKIKEQFQLDAVTIVGSREAVIERIAITGGSGADMITAAKAKGADVLITGDVGFHNAQLA